MLILLRSGNIERARNRVNISKQISTSNETDVDSASHRCCLTRWLFSALLCVSAAFMQSAKCITSIGAKIFIKISDLGKAIKVSRFKMFNPEQMIIDACYHIAIIKQCGLFAPTEVTLSLNTKISIFNPGQQLDTFLTDTLWWKSTKVNSLCNKKSSSNKSLKNDFCSKLYNDNLIKA